MAIVQLSTATVALICGLAIAREQPTTRPAVWPDRGASVSSDALTLSKTTGDRPGAIGARSGRAVRMVRPNLSPALRQELVASGGMKVVLEVRADETGHVSDVRVEQSSGNTNLDSTCCLAMYQWWFQPPVDEQGRPRRSTMKWTLAFRNEEFEALSELRPTTMQATMSDPGDGARER